MKRRQTYVEIPDDGLVAGPHGTLFTPEQAHQRAAQIMAGFDDLPPAERYAWNYAKVTSTFNPSSSGLRNFRRKAIKSGGAAALLEELGL